jgi:hypothetical protein
MGRACRRQGWPAALGTPGGSASRERTDRSELPLGNSVTGLFQPVGDRFQGKVGSAAVLFDDSLGSEARDNRITNLQYGVVI